MGGGPNAPEERHRRPEHPSRPPPWSLESLPLPTQQPSHPLTPPWTIISLSQSRQAPHPPKYATPLQASLRVPSDN